LQLTGTTTSATNIATNQTSGSLTIGGASATGAITFGRSTGTHAVNISTGTTASGSTKTISIGTGGISGSTTNITIGNLSLGGGTLTFGQATGTQTTNIQAGTTISGSTKTLNIGTGGQAGSATNIAIGSTTGTSTTTLNGASRFATANAFGYGTGSGAGGSVTQATDRNTDVTLNKPCGTIVLVSDITGFPFAFRLNNSFIGINDTIIINPVNNTPPDAYSFWIITARISAAGIAVINGYDPTGAPFGGDLTLNFSIIKGSVT
jgi:hypothetical protein